MNTAAKINTIVVSLLLIASTALMSGCKSKKQRTESKSSDEQTINIKELGARGDGKSDDTKYFVQALETFNEGQVIYIPNGTYILNETLLRGSCAYIKSNTSLIGESKEGVVIKLQRDQRIGVRMFSTQPNSQNIQIRNITFDGGLKGQTSTAIKTEHMHAIFINSSDNVRISNCHFKNAKGDGVYIHGPEIQSTKIVIDSCYFEANERNAITLGSGFDGVTISNNVIDCSATHCPIDSEPFKGICKNVTIINNRIFSNNTVIKNPIITLGGFPTKVVGYYIKDNTLERVGIHMVTAYDVHIENNTITTDGEVPCVNITYENSNIDIIENRLTSDVETIRAMATKHSHPFDITVLRNTLTTNSKTLASMILFGVKNVVVSENFINGPDDNNYAVFNLRSTRDLDQVEISRNKCKGFAYAANVRTYQSYKVSNVNFNSNDFEFKNEPDIVFQLGAFKNLIDVKESNNSVKASSVNSNK